MQKLLLLTSALLLARLSQGQIHYAPLYNYTPPPPGLNPAAMGYGYTNPNFREGDGSYQLPDGTWHAAQKMVFTTTKLTVKGETGKLKLTTATVQQFEIAQDTFLVLGNLPGRVQNTQPEFLESVFYRRGVRVLRLVSETTSTLRYFLQRPQAPLQLLPLHKDDFKKAMLPIVQGCPALVASITDGTLGPKDVVSIMQQYADCK